ncbi:hypothetical protein LCGC14_1423170 [marine sediment metagenome]|uniref:Uncharacterized protein n=1 Tax=marine sediment metagenome TaxID=412755 RepID=A0A0F9KBT7_9ZZZZ
MNKDKLRDRLELSPKEIRDIVDGADCHAEVCFTTGKHTQELLGWAKNLINETAQAQVNKFLNDPDLAWIDRARGFPRNPYPSVRYRYAKGDVEKSDASRYASYENTKKVMLKANILPVIPLSEMKEVEG